METGGIEPRKGPVALAGNLPRECGFWSDCEPIYAMLSGGDPFGSLFVGNGCNESPYGFNIFINMRIISGIYGRRRFDVPSSFSARPTTDFAKENIFNVVNNLVDLEGMDALDLFAGTGSISFELISRGCRNVTAIEKNNAHASFIAKVAKELKTDALALIRGDVFRYLNSAPKQSFDFIFADPPYALPELPEIPALVFERDLLRDGGIFIMEHPKTNDFSSLPYFYQHRVYGSVNFSIFLKEGEKTDA